MDLFAAVQHSSDNQHRIDAALFAFRSPLSKGVILADELDRIRPVVDLLDLIHRATVVV
jgi:hypothetical protein